MASESFICTPITFTPGRTGRLFIEFALTLAGAVIVSGFVALTLSPMMCAKLLKPHTKRNVISATIEGALDGITRGYAAALRFTLRHRWLILIIYAAIAVACYQLASTMKRELSPTEDRGTILSIINGPDGASIGYTLKYGKQLEAIAKTIPEIDRAFVVAGNPTVAQGIAFWRLTDWDERTRKVPEILKELQPKLLAVPGVLAFAVLRAGLLMTESGKARELA
jgi:multidrug efflux pump